MKIIGKDKYRYSTLCNYMKLPECSFAVGLAA
jgi:hypothetical protein